MDITQPIGYLRHRARMAKKVTLREQWDTTLDRLRDVEMPMAISWAESSAPALRGAYMKEAMIALGLIEYEVMAMRQAIIASAIEEADDVARLSEEVPAVESNVSEIIRSIRDKASDMLESGWGE